MADQILQEIKDRLNIVDVLSGYIQMKKAGTNYKAACPFHNEKTPSLMVSPQKQIWHCFGCGEGGDVFGFVMKYENLEFKEALKLLADKAGVRLPEYRPQDPKAEEENQRLLRINNFAARFYHETLLKDPKSKPAMEYLEKRGLTMGTIKQWQIGFAPDGFHVLEQALAAKKVPVEDMVKAGVLAKNERGQVYDRFRGRITFPIFNYTGDVVAFTARILHDDGKSAKYINSPETPVYHKSKVMFGLNFAKEEIRKKDEMVIVEGQMDCISLHQAGFKNVVASSGTAYNEQAAGVTQARRLARNIKLCFDSDAAGQNALRKTGELLMKMGFRIKVVQLRAVKDPDELVRKSPGLWEKAVSDAVWFLDYYIDQAQIQAPNDPVEQVHYISSQVAPLLGFVQDSLERDHYINRIVSKFGISEKAVREHMNPQQISRAPEQSASSKDPGLGLEKQLVGGMLLFPEFLDTVLQEGNVTDFEHPAIQRIVEVLFKLRKPSPEVTDDPVAKEGVFMVESQVEEMSGGRGAVLKELNKSFDILRLNAIKRQQKMLNLAIRQAELAGQKPKLLELSKEFTVLSEQRLKLENKI